MSNTPIMWLGVNLRYFLKAQVKLRKGELITQEELYSITLDQNKEVSTARITAAFNKARNEISSK